MSRSVLSAVEVLDANVLAYVLSYYVFGVIARFRPGFLQIDTALFLYLSRPGNNRKCSLDRIELDLVVEIECLLRASVLYVFVKFVDDCLVVTNPRGLPLF